MNKTISRTGYRTARHRGLTIVEIMVAAAAATIVVLATGVILVYGQRSWDRGLRQANLQREVALTMLRIKQSISAGTAAVVDGDYYGVQIFNSAGWIRYRYDPAANDLLFQLPDQEEQTLVDNLVADATFELDPNSVKIVIVDLRLEKDDSSARLSSKTLMRNFGS